jgi:hypothetical protein
LFTYRALLKLNRIPKAEYFASPCVALAEQGRRYFGNAMLHAVMLSLRLSHFLFRSLADDCRFGLQLVLLPLDPVTEAVENYCTLGEVVD